MIDTGLEGKTVIITGGASGIGKATAQAFAKEGCRVAIWDINEERGLATAKELSSKGGHCKFWKVDVTQSRSVEEATSSVISTWDTIHVLVNNAGITSDAQLIKWKDGKLASYMDDEQWWSVISVNLYGVFNCTRAVAPHMISQKQGVILNASSVVAIYGNFGQTNYVASKAGVMGMTKVWARELGKYGIRVNAVAPGFILTEMTSTVPHKVLDTVKSRTPLRRLGTAEEVASVYLWLASNQASFVTGAVISVDGGLVL